jgi:enoyl-CoA hydratase
MSVNGEQAVLTDRRGDVLVITLNRPNAMNSFTGSLIAGLANAFAELDTDETLKVGVITGAGKGFCAGLDLKEFQDKGMPDGVFELFERGAQKPLVAAVESFALAGGLEVALLCDLIVASEGAKLGIPEVTVGLFAGAGGLLRLPGRIGALRTAELALTGDFITAEQGLAWGLVNRVVPRGETLANAQAIAERIARNAPLSVLASKQILRDTAGMQNSEGWAYQADIFERLLLSKDAKEGPRAFAEKRRPTWVGA